MKRMKSLCGSAVFGLLCLPCAAQDAEPGSGGSESGAVRVEARAVLTEREAYAGPDAERRREYRSRIDAALALSIPSERDMAHFRRVWDSEKSLGRVTTLEIGEALTSRMQLLRLQRTLETDQTLESDARRQLIAEAEFRVFRLEKHTLGPRSPEALAKWGQRLASAEEAMGHTPEYAAEKLRFNASVGLQTVGRVGELPVVMETPAESAKMLAAAREELKRHPGSPEIHRLAAHFAWNARDRDAAREHGLEYLRNAHKLPLDSHWGRLHMRHTDYALMIDRVQGLGASEEELEAIRSDPNQKWFFEAEPLIIDLREVKKKKWSLDFMS